MDETDKAEKSLRRVGRPPKAKPAIEGSDVVEYAPPVVLEVIAPAVNPFAQAFAQMVWNAQSPTEPRAWRLMRAAEAMKNKGYSMDGIVL